MITVDRIEEASIQCDECEQDTYPRIRIKMTLENIYLCETHAKELYKKLGEVVSRNLCEGCIYLKDDGCATVSCRHWEKRWLYRELT